MKTEPQEEHIWLQKLVGEWTYETDCSSGPDQPPVKLQGSESVRSFGDLWILAEGRGEMRGGGTGLTLLTLGHDPQKQRYVGTWIGSMMAHLWLYDGELEPAGNALTLHAEGPGMSATPKRVKYKDVIEFQGPGHRIFTSHALGDDGRWQQFMTVHYRRKK